MDACGDSARGRARRIDEFVFHEQTRAHYSSDTRSAPQTAPACQFEALKGRFASISSDWGGDRVPASQLAGGGVPVTGTDRVIRRLPAAAGVARNFCPQNVRDHEQPNVGHAIAIGEQTVGRGRRPRRSEPFTRARVLRSPPRFHRQSVIRAWSRRHARADRSTQQRVPSCPEIRRISGVFAWHSACYR
jgi:hypothetical protein